MVMVSKASLVSRNMKANRLSTGFICLAVSFLTYRQFFKPPVPLHVLRPDPFDMQYLVPPEPESSSSKSERRYLLPTTIYHRYKPESRSGEVLEDMLMCHAYSFHQDQTYGGACGDVDYTAMQHQSLIDALGLRKLIHFACPSHDKKKQEAMQHSSTTTTDDEPPPARRRRSVIQTKLCKEYDTKIWTPEYIDWLRERVEYPTKLLEADGKGAAPYTIAVHMRRDEVTPCMDPKDDFYDSYLPNSYYHTLIDQHMKPGAKVVIFTQSKSYESLSSFTDKGYEIHMDSDMVDAWKTMVNADVLIISKSSFSVIPGVLNRGKVIYAPFWHYPLKHWTMPSLELLDKTNGELARMKLKCQRENKNNNNNDKGRKLQLKGGRRGGS